MNFVVPIALSVIQSSTRHHASRAEAERVEGGVIQFEDQADGVVYQIRQVGEVAPLHDSVDHVAGDWFAVVKSEAALFVVAGMTDQGHAHRAVGRVHVHVQVAVRALDIPGLDRADEPRLDRRHSGETVRTQDGER